MNQTLPEGPVRVSIEYKKSRVKLGKTKSLLLTITLPTETFFRFVPREYYEKFKSFSSSYINMIPLLKDAGFQKQQTIFRCLEEDQKFLLNGKLVLPHLEGSENK